VRFEVIAGTSLNIQVY